MMRLTAAVLLAAIATPNFVTHTAAQESPVPDRRVVSTTGADFYGGDIGSILETTFQICRSTCQNNPECRALTFNTRANACFLKSGVERVEAFDGAISARMVDTSDGTRTRAAQRRGEISFASDDLLRQARDLAANLGGRVAAASDDVAGMRQAALTAEAAGNLPLAASHLSTAVAFSDAPDDWRDLARVWGLMRGENSSDRRRLHRDALSAAINAYLRADGDAGRATALAELANRLEATNRGRLMIPALQLAQNLAPRRETQDRLAYAISNYGFRVTGHTVDSDPATARMCVQFSEELAEAGVDYAPYVVVEGSANLPVEAKGQDLCVDGLSHGQRYKLTVRDGLPSGGGDTLRKSFTVESYIRDRSPSIRFAGKAHVLPKSTRASIPIVTVNLNEVDIEIHRIGERNLLPGLQRNFIDRALSPYMQKTIEDELGVPVWSGTAEITNQVNADVVTALPVGDAVTTFEPGIYAMVARTPGDTDEWDRKATQWFIVTDLGLATMTGADGLHGFVRSLSSAGPVANAKVALVAKNNEVLGQATSDANGYVRFAPGLTRGTGSMAPAMLTVDDGTDFAFLDLSKPGFDLSDRGVEGRPAPGPVDIFATTERGVYRPGEVVHLTALARDGKAEAIADIPLTLVVSRPDGVEYQRQVLTDQGAGGRAHSMRLGHGVPRGTWKAKLHTDPNAAPVTELSFLVDDFVPEKIDFDLEAPEGMVAAEAELQLSLNVQYLYGAPGADLPVDGEVRLKTVDGLPGYAGFKFGLADEEVTTISDSLPGAITDADGNAVLDARAPDGGALTRPTEMTAIVRVTDSSGRPVERTLTRPVAPAAPVIGIRPLFEDQAEEGGNARFEVVAIGTDGQQMALPNVGWTLSKINYDWQWYELNGRWRWESITSRQRIANGTVALTADGRAVVEAGVEWGEYELKLVNLDGETAAASHKFYAGWYTGGATTDTPDVLEIGLDRQNYRIGDTVKVRLKPRNAGKVLVAVVDNRLIETKVVDVTAGETSIDLTVTPDWGPGAYVTATLIQPMDADAGRNPARALGLAWAPVDPAERKLEVAFLTPDQVAPRGPMDASVQISGLPENETAYVTVAAVDLGILNLTGFQSPNPQGHYFGQRALGVEMRDLYGNLIDGLQGVPGKLRSGGDAAQARLKSPPPVEELVAYFSGVVTTDWTGKATVSFDVPDFNGTVRLMAVAWTRSAVGQAEKDVLVRDPIVVSAATPRFMAPRDQTRLLVSLAHASGPAGDVALSIESDGGVSVPFGPTDANVTLAEGQIQQVSLPLTAAEIGDHKLRLRTVTPSGQSLLKTLTIPVRMNDPEVSRQNRIALPTGGTLTVNADTFAGLELGTGRATLGVGPVAQFDAPGLLRSLDQYPYGCTEQITSKAMPLVYLRPVAEALGMTAAKDLDKRIADAIASVLENQSGAGSFGLWRPDRGDLWLDSYVTDFLSRAKAEGHAVPPKAFEAALDNLLSNLSYVSDFDQGGEDIAYALMVLAREGAASIGDLRYFADAKAEAFATPLA
ncbi:MAG: alpha-2-macroglobulin family protein, partial [Pseudomonadota bacterium]